MKHRILSLVLALVLICATLTGCAYNIDRDDLSKYAALDLDALRTALQAIEIADSKDYSVAEGDEADAYRDQKLAEEIEDALKGAVDTDDTDAKKTEGVFADRQLLSYCYYVTAEDGKVYYASSMKIASPSSLLIGSVKDDALAKTIADALKASGKDLKDCVYTAKSSSSDTADGGKLAFVTYTREYTLEEDGEVKKETYTMQPMILPAAKDETTFVGKLVGESLATTLFSDGVTVSETVKNGENDVTVDVKYSSVKIELVAQTDAAVDTEYTYTDSKSATDTLGKTNSIKDTKLTYHIFPVYYYEVAELSAKSILTVIYGESLTTSVLPLFTEKDDDDKYVYKYTDESGEEVTLYSLISDIATKKSAVSSASSDEKTEKQEALDKALDELWDKVAKCGEDMETKIVDEYKTKLSDGLKENYEDDIRDKVAAEVWALIDSSVTLSSYPEKAVKEAKEAIFENLKYTYYTETETVNSEKKNLRDLYANVKEYIRQKSDYKADTYEESDALMQKEAERQVGELVKVYVTAQAMGLSTTVNKTDMEKCAQNMAAKIFGYDSYDEVPEGSLSSVDYFAQYYLSYYDESSFRRAIVFDRLMDHILETDEGRLDFKNLHYAFKTEKTDDTAESNK